jgi:hypothetical protein
VLLRELKGLGDQAAFFAALFTADQRFFWASEIR